MEYTPESAVFATPHFVPLWSAYCPLPARGRGPVSAPPCLFSLKYSPTPFVYIGRCPKQ